MEYQSLRQHLQSGRLGHFDPVDRWECEERESTDAPTDFRSARDLLSSLPHWAQVVCALTAAEMSLPIWEESEFAQSLLPLPLWKLSEKDLLTPEVQTYFTPRRAVETLRIWLNGDANQEDLEQELDIALQAADAVVHAVHSEGYVGSTNYAEAAAAAITEAIDTAFDPEDASDNGAYAGAEAAQAYSASMPREQFFRWWWCNCKRRLAIMGLEKAELQWWQ